MRKNTQDILEQFKTYLAHSEYAFSTQAGYFVNVRLFCQWFEETKEEKLHPENVTPADIQEYQRHLARKYYKTHTIDQKLTSISTFMKWARAKNLVDSNPVRKIQQKNKKRQRQKIHYLNPEEQSTLLLAVEESLRTTKTHQASKQKLTKHRDISFIIFLLNTGLEVSEALRLRLKDLEVSERSGRVKIILKGKKQREVPLNQKARQAIKAWLDIRPKQVGNDYLWIPVENASKARISNQVAKQSVQRIGKTVGLKNLTPDTLRHTFAKNLVEQGVGLEKVAALLGLESLDTARLYITSDNQNLEEAVESIA